jgi:6-pyruvoyltetrahydropterin/6-carboxytetrahydropterin synthase
MHTAERYHDISCGHRVVGHESKCRHLHGHNYRIHFVCAALKQIPKPEYMAQGMPTDYTELDHIGRVIDFTAIKEKLCMWVEDNWDHKFLAWEDDTVMSSMISSCVVAGNGMRDEDYGTLYGSMVWTPFNPTAENMAQYLVDVIGPMQLKGTGVKLVTCRVEETMKCSATYSIG